MQTPSLTGTLRALTLALGLWGLGWLATVAVADAPNGHFVAADGRVTDMSTKLIWQQPAPDATYGFDDAVKYCTDLDLGGKGWRLPSVTELQTLVDETLVKPAIDPTAFPGTVSDYYWSGSTVATHDDHAWAVSFAFGYDNFFPRTEKQRVRCVR
jgi:hypothetical protein